MTTALMLYFLCKKYLQSEKFMCNLIKKTITDPSHCTRIQAPCWGPWSWSSSLGYWPEMRYIELQRVEQNVVFVLLISADFDCSLCSLTGLAGFFMSLSRRALAMSVADLAPFLAKEASSSSSSFLSQAALGRGWKKIKFKLWTEWKFTLYSQSLYLRHIVHKNNSKLGRQQKYKAISLPHQDCSGRSWGEGVRSTRWLRSPPGARTWTSRTCSSSESRLSGRGWPFWGQIRHWFTKSLRTGIGTLNPLKHQSPRDTSRLQWPPTDWTLADLPPLSFLRNVVEFVIVLETVTLLKRYHCLFPPKPLKIFSVTIDSFELEACFALGWQVRLG